MLSGNTRISSRRTTPSIMTTWSTFPVRLFEKLPSVLREVQGEITHLIVDEYQDINPVQYTLLRLLSRNAELCVVGDPNQSIYGFRGGSPGFIRRFSIDFPGAVTFPPFQELPLSPVPSSGLHPRF